MKNPPVFVAVIGFFAMLAGASWIVLALSVLGFDWFGVLGDLPKYEHVGIWGWLALVVGICWIAIATGLWTLQQWAWVMAMAIAGVSLFEALLWFIQEPGSGIALGASIMPVIIMLYLSLRSVRSDFGLVDEDAKAL